MVCLKCGYCCTEYAVVIVKDPKKGPTKDNLIVHKGDGPCPHLGGDCAGEYYCKVHNEPWYKGTPCFDYGQIEISRRQLSNG